MVKENALIYFIQSRKDNAIKIGCTDSNPELRLAELQNGDDGHLVLLCTTPGGVDDEQNLHERFSEYRLKGEWFQPGHKLIRYLMALREVVPTP